MDDYFCLLCHRASYFEVALISIKNRSKNFAGTLKKAFPRGFYALAFALVYFIVPAKIASMIVWQTLKRLCIAGTKISAPSWLSSSLILSEKLRFPQSFSGVAPFIKLSRLTKTRTIIRRSSMPNFAAILATALSSISDAL